MKIFIDSKTISDAFADVCPFAPSKSSLQILKYAKITTKGQRMKIEANDTQVSIRKYIDGVECDMDGSFLVPCEEFYKFVASIKQSMIEISVTDNIITIKHKNGTSEFGSATADEYPVMGMLSDSVTEITLPSSLLRDCINSGKMFVGYDDLRPQMKAIYAYIENGEFGYCATDSRKMITNSTRIDNMQDLSVNWYIEPAVFRSLAKICNGGENVIVKIAPAHVSYKVGGTVISTVQTTGAYPNFKSVIPKSWAVECHVDKGQLIESLRRVTLFCEQNRFLKLSVSDSEVNLCVDNINAGKRSSDVLSHNGCNGNLTIGLQADNFLDCVSVGGSEEVSLRFNDASKPMMVYCADDPNMNVIIMPMRLN